MHKPGIFVAVLENQISVAAGYVQEIFTCEYEKKNS